MVPTDNLKTGLSNLSRFHATAAQLKAMCHELAVCGVPQTLVHGDFHSQNVVVTDKRYIYFDWSDGAIAHPFFDAVLFLQEIEKKLPDVPDVRVRLCNVYLEPWTVYMPKERLISVFERSQPLAALYHAIIYHEITRNLEAEARWEMEGAVPFYLKSLLTQIKPTPATISYIVKPTIGNFGSS